MSKAILPPHASRALNNRLRGPWGPTDYPASSALQRALNRTIVVDDKRPITTIDVYIDAPGTRTGLSNVGSTDVYKDCVESLVQALSTDEKVAKVTVAGRVVYTRPVCTGGVDSEALQKAVA